MKSNPAAQTKQAKKAKIPETPRTAGINSFMKQVSQKKPIDMQVAVATTAFLAEKVKDLQEEMKECQMKLVSREAEQDQDQDYAPSMMKKKLEKTS